MKELNITLVNGVLTINGEEVNYIVFCNGMRLVFPINPVTEINVQTGDIKGNKNVISGSSIKCSGNFTLGDKNSN